MIKLLNTLTDPDNTPIAVVHNNNDTVIWIITIIAIAILTTLIAAYVIIYLYNKTNGKRKAIKYVVITIEIILIVLFIAFGYATCASLK